MTDKQDKKKELSKELVRKDDDFFNVVKVVEKTDPPNASPKT